MHRMQRLGAASGWGAQRHQTMQGPHRVQQWLGDFEILPAPEPPSDLPPQARWAEVRQFNAQLSARVETIAKTGSIPFVIGGDHAIAMGTWWGVVRARQCAQSLGLIWIDAHMDAHVPATSPSQAMHGMPVAGLLGYGTDAWGAPLVPAIRAEHLVLIGVRSFEEGEADFLKAMGVTIYFMSDVQSQGFSAVLEKARAQVMRGTQAFGVSLDLDAFDPEEVPGVGSPAPDGLHVAEVLPPLAQLLQDPHLAGVEIVEYNPMRDKENKTGQLVHQIWTACHAPSFGQTESKE